LLPGGYLKTVPTAGLIGHLAANYPELQESGARLGLVFGLDNLAWMASSSRPGALLEKSDLILLGREVPEVVLRSDPSKLLSVVRYVDICTSIPIMFEGKAVFGGTVGRFVNTIATGASALTLLRARCGRPSRDVSRHWVLAACLPQRLAR
jgi:hypothetical protein